MSLQNSRQISDVKVLLKMGSDGAGIIDIELTSSQGNVDTYTITLSNGNKYTFTVTNGLGIDNIAKTDTQGLVDTYTIYMEDGSTYTFTVTNGKDGQDGGSSIMFLITSDAGSTVTVTDPDGTVTPATQVQGSTTEWECEATAFGNYTITSVLGGSAQTQTVTADICKLYLVHVEHFAATIAVTYPTGATCTCVGSSESYTATTNPYTFMVHNADTYTITATDSTHTKSEQVTITTDGQSESVTLTFIPDGSTVTPTDDIQTWLNCADIWDKAYTTISQVLADPTTLAALIADSNAVDYMVRSTTWASNVCTNQTAMSYIGLDDYCADILLANSTWRAAICNSTYFESVLTTKVPTMTSDTTPSGIATSSSIYSGQGISPTTYLSFHAFDGDDHTKWAPLENEAGSWVAYQFPSNVKIYKSSVLLQRVGTQGSNTLKIQTLKNNSWEDITGFTSIPINTLTNLNSNNIIEGEKFRALFNGVMIPDGDGGQYTLLCTLQFYGRA